MSQPDKEKLLSKIMNYIPGVKGYREKEARRDMDKQLREYIADQLDESRGRLEELKRQLADASQLKMLGQVDRLTKQLLKIADTLRFTSYGYAGFFAANAVGEAQLEAIYQYDHQLLKQVEKIKSSISPPASTLPEQKELDSLEALLRELDQRITQRKHIVKSAIQI